MFYCEQNYFQSNLNPKEFFFSLSLVFFRAFVLHWLKISVVCCLWFQFYCWNICLLFQHDTGLSVLEVCLWKPYKPEWYWQEVRGWILCYLFYLFFLIMFMFFFFVFSQRGVECAIPHTAIYAGQELWHFIFCLWDL